MKTVEECSELLNKIMHDVPENKKCFDCIDETSPRYVCINFSTFVCSCCANIHKEFGHMIKCLNVFGFNLNEILQLQATGNKPAAEKWLARWTSEEHPEPDPNSHSYKDDARKYIKLKYVEKKWAKSLPTSPSKDGASSTIDERNSPQLWQQHDYKPPLHLSPVCAAYATPPFGYPQYLPQQLYAVPMPYSPSIGPYGYPQYPPMPVNQMYYQSLAHPRPRPPSYPPFLDRPYLDYGAFQYDSGADELALHAGGKDGIRHPINRSVTMHDGLSRVLSEGSCDSQMEMDRSPHDPLPMIKSASAGSFTCLHEATQIVDTCKSCAHRENLEKEELVQSKWKVNNIVSKMAGLFAKNSTTASSSNTKAGISSS